MLTPADLHHVSIENGQGQVRTACESRVFIIMSRFLAVRNRLAVVLGQTGLQSDVAVALLLMGGEVDITLKEGNCVHLRDMLYCFSIKGKRPQQEGVVCYGGFASYQASVTAV